MIAIEIDEGQIKSLKEAAAKAKKSFPREFAGAINAVSRKTKTKIGKDIRSVVALKAAEAKRPISIVGRATPGHLSATVSLRKTKRLGLRHFGARQDKSGVSYRISKQGGRQRVNGAFQGPTPNIRKMSWKGNAFRRIGKSRLPIVKLLGVSAYGAYAKNELSGPQVEEINEEITRQMERRINLNVLRANGLVQT